MTARKSTWRWFFGPLAVVIVALAVGETPLRELLRYDRGLMGIVQPWRFISAHLVHLSWSHTLLNGAGLVLIGLLFQTRATLSEWWIALLLSVAAIDLGLLLWAPALDWYVGLSGALHGLFVFGAAREWQGGQRSGAILLLVVASKLAFEQFAGALPLTASAAGGPVVVDAHLYGSLGGALAYGLMHAYGGRRARTH